MTHQQERHLQKKRNLGKQQHRIFGLILAFVLFAWTLFFYLSYQWSVVALLFPTFTALAFCLIALLAPDRLSGFHHRWVSGTETLNRWLVTGLLTLIFYLLVTPMGLLKRTFGNDEIRHLNKVNRLNSDSYRYRSADISDKDMEDPF